MTRNHVVVVFFTVGWLCLFIAIYTAYNIAGIVFVISSVVVGVFTFRTVLQLRRQVRDREREK